MMPGLGLYRHCSLLHSASPPCLPRSVLSVHHVSIPVRMSSRFRVVEHEVRSQHTREYLAATVNGDEDTPRLAVKQYIPLDNTTPKPGDVTIVAAHANGFPKEMYEPLWDEILDTSAQHGYRIRAIWHADFWNQGQSGVLNEAILGKDPSWFDHSRDLLYLINQKQSDMPQPIVGIGHSMGATQLTHLALFHPRLLKALVLVDPVIQLPNGGVAAATRSISRRDIWESYDAAQASFRGRKFYQSWDPRVLDLWLQHGLRPVPTALYPPQSQEKGKPDERVTLTTSKHQEVFLYVRPTFTSESWDTAPVTENKEPVDRDPAVQGEHPGYPFYRPEPVYVFKRLAELRPSVLYLYGETSDFSTPERREEHRSRTGTGVGGSGGAVAGEVKQVVLPRSGHLVPFEQVDGCAVTISKFIGHHLEKWRKDNALFQQEWNQKPNREKATIDQWWLQSINPQSLGNNSARKTRGKASI